MLNSNLSVSEFYTLLALLVGTPIWAVLLLFAACSWWMARKQPRRYKAVLGWLMAFCSPLLMLAFPVLCLQYAGQQKGATVFPHVRYAILVSLPSLPLGLFATALAYRLQQRNMHTIQSAAS